MTTITITPQGEVSFIGALPIDLPMTGIKRTRVSHIVPLNPLLRTAFRLLRLAFGEQGRAAAWTRTWPGPWKAVIIATSESYVSDSRADCIRWELEQFNRPKFDY